MFAGGGERAIVSTADAARKPFAIFAEPNDSTAREPLLRLGVCPMSIYMYTVGIRRSQWPNGRGDALARQGLKVSPP